MPHATSGGLPLLEYLGCRSGDLVGSRCVACGVRLTRRLDEPILPQAGYTATPEQRGQALGEYVWLALPPPRRVDGIWQPPWTLEDQRLLQDVFVTASPAAWLASGLEPLRHAWALASSRADG